MTTSATSSPRPNRLARFRELRARLDPAGDPARAFADGLYVAVPGSVSARLAAELAVAPTSAHLLVGGVGSGKTTELLAIERQLNELGDIRAFYVDVTKHHDITKMIPGALILQAALVIALAASRETKDEDKQAVASQTLAYVTHLAHGYWEAHEEWPDDDDGGTRIPGVLVHPNPLDQTVLTVRSHLRNLQKLIGTDWAHSVVLLDGLDRMTDLAGLEKVIQNDVKALRDLGIGTVLVGPLRAVYGIDRSLLEHFVSHQYQPWIDPTRASDGLLLLSAALRRRLPEDAMDEAALETLVRNSGGVLRDLMSLAQSACVEAYMNGSDLIAKPHADAAVDAFGRKHLQGLRPAEIEVLQRVRTVGAFVQTSEDDLALLMSRRVLEYVGSKEERRYVVHPTIAPFLKQLAGGR